MTPSTSHSSLLDTDASIGMTRLRWLGKGPVEASPATVKAELEKLEFLCAMDAHTLDLSVLPEARTIGSWSNQAAASASVGSRGKSTPHPHAAHAPGPVTVSTSSLCQISLIFTTSPDSGAVLDDVDVGDAGGGGGGEVAYDYRVGPV